MGANTAALQFLLTMLALILIGGLLTIVGWPQVGIGIGGAGVASYLLHRFFA